MAGMYGRVRFVERIWGITHNSKFFGGLVVYDTDNDML